MDTNRTELVFILDRSGSMSGLESDTIGGYNAMLLKQKAEPGEAVVTTALFDDKYELLHDRIDIRAVSPIKDKDYFVGGSTALLDAVGRTIHKIENAQEHTAEPMRAGRVLFVITTDGLENASREYSPDQVKALIEQKKKENGWEFLFLGANIDAVSAAAGLGIGADRAANFVPDAKGAAKSFQAMSAAISDVRASRPVAPSWKKSLDEDMKRRAKT